jgi:E3 ubiquitin-protein ligase Topors
VDEAEGFLLEHALMPLPRTWPPLPHEQSQSDRLTATRKKMDWEDEAKKHPDEPVEIPVRKDTVEEDANKERCVICLMALRDRTIVGVCGHEFCVGYDSQ